MVMVDSELDSGLKSNAGKSVLAFSKMQALGNDFLLVFEANLEDALNTVKPGWKAKEAKMLALLAGRLCNRHYGVGADGLIIARAGSKADRLSWTYLNSDGSSSVMCGNGLRCLALFAVNNGFQETRVGSKFIVETGKGPVEIDFRSEDRIKTDLGEPIFEAEKIPVAFENPEAYETKSGLLKKTLKFFDGQEVEISVLSMGNPHCVVFRDDFADERELEKIALLLQVNPLFPQGVNVEFVKADSRGDLSVIVFERGCGRTQACASGAAASLVAAHLHGMVERKANVHLEGGSLEIEFKEENKHVYISGPAKFVFDGKIDLQAILGELEF